MLHFDAVKPNTLAVLKQLSQIKEFQNHFLVGGTALTLHIGHRLSEDIDFFTEHDFNSEKLLSMLRQQNVLTNPYCFTNTLRFWINDVKVEVLTYKYPLLDKIIEANGVRLLSMKDLVPMKLSAVESRGSKKDFYDLYFLVNYFSLKEMLQLYKQKFNIDNSLNILKALCYFDDAENEPDPIMLQSHPWNDVKSKIKAVVDNYTKE